MVLELVTGLLALLVALFVPGYFLSLAFFARKGEIDAIERVLFSFVFSITFLPLLVLVENMVLGIPINIVSVAGTFLLIVLAGLGAYLKRIGVIPIPKFAQKILPQVPREEAVPIIPIGKK